MPVPERVPIKHYRGDTLGLKLRLWDDAEKTDPTSLVGAGVTAQVRSNPDSEEITASFTVSVSTNEITLTLFPEQTALLPEDSTYDVQIDWHNDGTTVQTVLAGTLTAEPDVSRDA